MTLAVRGTLAGLGVLAVAATVACVWPAKITATSRDPRLRIYRVAWHDKPFMDNYAPNMVSHYAGLIGSSATLQQRREAEWAAHLRGWIFERFGPPYAMVGSSKHGGLVIFCDGCDGAIDLVDSAGHTVCQGCQTGSRDPTAYIFMMDAALPGGLYHLRQLTNSLADIRVRQ